MVYVVDVVRIDYRALQTASDFPLNNVRTSIDSLKNRSQKMVQKIRAIIIKKTNPKITSP